MINCCKKPIPCEIFCYFKICLSHIIYYYIYLLISENAFSVKVRMWSLQKKKGSRWLIKNLNKLDRLQWESNPDLCKGCTVPSLGILWTHNNWPDFQLALLALWIEHYVHSSRRSRFDSWYEFFSGLYQPLRLFIQQREPPPIPIHIFMEI